MPKSMLDKSNNIKTVKLPFAGFYQSIYDTDLENLADNIGKKAAEYAIDNYDNNKFENIIMAAYVAHLHTTISEHIDGVMFISHAPIVEKYAGGTTGITADIDAALLPSLDVIQAAFDGILDIKQACIAIATARLTSYDGFLSFYDPNIALLFNAPLASWAEPYLDCLLFAIVQAVALDDPHTYNLREGDDFKQAAYAWEFHNFYGEHLRGNGRDIEAIVWDCLTSDQCDELNKLVDHE